ncbi:MAG: DNA repair protein RecN [Acidimicrobiia bacterium]
MLTELRVENLGIIDEVTVVLGGGLTAITGETGAGKTLLVEAIELLVGGRADPSLVRDGTREARVEGRFVDPASDDELVLARVVPVDGRSRAYVNGRLATATELAELGTRLVDLHGQHAHQSLLAPAVQRAALDRFAGGPATGALEAYRAARAEVRRLEQALEALGGDERTRARELDLLRFQVAEIDAAAIADEGEDEALESEATLLADAGAHREALLDAYAAVDGPALDGVGRAAAALAARAPLRELCDRLRAVQAELAELGHDLRSGAEGIADDPGRLEAIQQRRRLLRDLRRKYGETLAEVVRFGDEARARLAALAGYEERAAELEARVDAGRAAAEAAAYTLTEVRRAAAAPLAEAVAARARELAMPSARFGVDIGPIEPGDEGADLVTYMFSANEGEPLRPLARAASGGELARTMLAVRRVLSEAPPTLIFDEVDAGIGGEAGTTIGRELANVGRDHQVLCVTHLAQVAAFADAQLEVTKRATRGRTTARVALVLDDARVAALSRMLGGVGSSAHARAHAAELLDAAVAGQGAGRGGVQVP